MPDLRSYLDLLEEKGEVLHIKEEVDPRFEVAAVTRLVAGQQGSALLFENIKRLFHTGFNQPFRN